MDASSVLRNVSSFYYYFWWLFHISCYNFYLLMLWFFFLLVRHCVLFDACIVIAVICSLNILMNIKWRVRKIPSNIVLLVVTPCLWLAGPVVMDMAGYTERGFKRKLAVQALFGKVFYLSEVSDQTVKIVPLTNCLYGSVLFLFLYFFFFFLLQTTLILIIRRFFCLHFQTIIYQLSTVFSCLKGQVCVICTQWLWTYGPNLGTSG